MYVQFTLSTGTAFQRCFAKSEILLKHVREFQRINSLLVPLKTSENLFFHILTELCKKIFSIKNFFKKWLMDNFIFCTMETIDED